MKPFMDDDGAMFSRGLLVEIGLDPANSPKTRLLALAAERANQSGRSEWEHNELCVLLAQANGKPMPAAGVSATLTALVDDGYINGAPTLREMWLNREHVQPVGLLIEGERFGALEIIGKANREGFYITACQCGRRRTFSGEHLLAGLTSDCRESRRHPEAA